MTANKKHETIALMAASVYGGFLSRPQNSSGVEIQREDYINRSIVIATEIYDESKRRFQTINIVD